MTMPAVMVFLSLILKPDLNRWVNMVLGAAYSVIVWYAWSWPRQEPDRSPLALPAR